MSVYICNFYVYRQNVFVTLYGWFFKIVTTCVCDKCKMQVDRYVPM